MKHTKTTKMSEFWFWVPWFVEHDQIFAEDQYTKFFRLTASDFAKEQELFWSYSFYIDGELSKKKAKKVLSAREKLQKCLAMVGTGQPKNLLGSINQFFSTESKRPQGRSNFNFKVTFSILKVNFL